MNIVTQYAAQAGLAAAIFFAAGLLGRALWEDRKEGRDAQHN